MPQKTRIALLDDPDSSTSTLGNMLELPGTSSSSTSQELPFCQPKKKPTPLKYEVGDLIWAKFKRRPWWPCRICSDPLINTHSKMKVSNRRPYRQYYVEAFGDPSEKAWVAGKAIVMFEGRHQFEELPVLRRRGKQKEKEYRHKVPQKILSKWEASVGLAEQYDDPKGSKNRKCVRSSIKLDSEEDMPFEDCPNDPESEHDLLLNGCLNSLAFDSEHSADEKEKPCAKSRVRKTVDNPKRTSVKKSHIQFEAHKDERRGKIPENLGLNFISGDVSDKQASNELSRIANSLTGSSPTPRSFLFSSCGKNTAKKDFETSNCDSLLGLPEAALISKCSGEKKKPQRGLVCSSKVQLCYIGAGDEEKRSDSISICTTSDDGSSDLDPLDHSSESDNSVLEITDTFDRTESMLSMQKNEKVKYSRFPATNRVKAKQKSLIINSHTDHLMDYTKTTEHGTETSPGNSDPKASTFICKAPPDFRNDSLPPKFNTPSSISSENSLAKSGPGNQILLQSKSKPPKIRSIKCKHKEDPVVIEPPVSNEDCSLKCCSSDPKGSPLASISKSGKADGLKLLSNMHEKTRDSSDIETAVVKHVLSELKELSYRSLSEDVSDPGTPRPPKPLLYTSASGQSHVPLEPDYKFSTLLMMLKDMHDSKTKEQRLMTSQNLVSYRSPGLVDCSTTSPAGASKVLVTGGSTHNSEKNESGTRDSAHPSPTGGDSAALPGELSTSLPNLVFEKRDLCASGKSRSNCVTRRNCRRSKLLSKLDDGFSTQLGKNTMNRKALKTERKRKANRLPEALEAALQGNREGGGSLSVSAKGEEEDASKEEHFHLKGHITSEENTHLSDVHLDNKVKESDINKISENAPSVEKSKGPELDSEVHSESDEHNGVHQVVPKKRWQHLNQRRTKPRKRTNRFREKENSEGAFGVLLPGDPVQKGDDPPEHRSTSTSILEDALTNPNSTGCLDSVGPQLNVCDKTNANVEEVEKEPGIPSLTPQSVLPEPAIPSEKKRLRKPSKWLLEYTEEYDQIFAPKKKQKKVQEQVLKRKSDATAGDVTKKRKTITIENKVEIIKRAERGERPSVIGKALGCSRSTIGNVLKDKVRIMEHVKGSALMKATPITKQRNGLIIEMEKLLLIWLDDQNQHDKPVSLTLVQEKAQSLFSDLKAARAGNEGDYDEEFVASRGWFNRFKMRANLHNIKVQDEAASGDLSAASDFPEMLKKIIEEGGYLTNAPSGITQDGSETRISSRSEEESLQCRSGTQNKQVDENSLISTKEEPPVLEREAPFLEGPVAQSELTGGHAELPQLTLSVPMAPGVSPRLALQTEELVVKPPGNYESKRQRKPTKKLLESNDLDPGFMPKKGDMGLSKKCFEAGHVEHDITASCAAARSKEFGEGTAKIFDKPRKRKRQRHAIAKMQYKRVRNDNASKETAGSE